MMLTREQIMALYSQRRTRGSYAKLMAEMLGVSYEEYVASIPPPKPQPPSREERLREIMLKRYGVPQALLDAYDEEVKDYDW